MNSINIHIVETLDAARLDRLKDELTRVPHVAHVALNPALPHELLVEYEADHNLPVRILNRLSKQGLHSDIQYC
ncbi:MAG TPA: hypothetical protein VIR60_10965 [Gammaproteobacteria bacterium]